MQSIYTLIEKTAKKCKQTFAIVEKVKIRINIIRKIQSNVSVSQPNCLKNTKTNLQLFKLF